MFVYYIDEPVSPVVHWEWCGIPTKKQARGRGTKEYYQSIIRDNETINVSKIMI